MSDIGKAIFLSYAREDADAARRIAEALRASGLEVWFDENELRGGDAWDAKLRTQIRSCTLFLAVISATTQARGEGYFRREWKLAVERTHDMAAGMVFLVPVVIDDTREADAIVPEEFMRVQWTRLPSALPTPQFVTQVKRLFEGPKKPVLATAPRPPTLPPMLKQAAVAKKAAEAAEAAQIAAPGKSGVPAWIWIVAAMLILCGTAAFLWLRTPAAASPPAQRPEAVATPKPAPPAPAAVLAKDDKSIAVLAFADLSEKHDSEYFSDGISEELLNVLAKIPGLRVSARTSAFYFKGKDTPIPEIAQKLGVAYVVEGSVRKAGDKVRITAQLIKAADGFHVWSDTFTRDPKDLFAVQDEIAGLIAQNLELKIGIAVTKAPRVINPEAHQLYLQGKYYINRATLEDMARATTLLQRALEIEPTFAAAWAALSNAGWFRGGYGLNRQDFEEGYALARRAADRAIELDPELAAGHLARLDVQGSVDFDWKGARESLRRAKALAPDDSEVLFREAQFIFTFGQTERALDLMRKVVALDPVHAQVHMSRGYFLLAAHRFDEAEAAFRQVAELSPSAPWGHAGVSLSLIARGRHDEAVAEAEKETPEWSRLYALALARWGQGRRAEADAVLAQFIQANADVAAYQIATVYAYRGDADKTFEWLERAYRQHDPGLSWSRPDFFLERVHADPRWAAFLKKMGVADEQGG